MSEPGGDLARGTHNPPGYRQSLLADSESRLELEYFSSLLVVVPRRAEQREIINLRKVLTLLVEPGVDRCDEVFGIRQR